MIDAACRAADDRSWAYSGIMRYPDGGGLSARARDKREAVRMQAAAWSAAGVTPSEVARRLRISNNSAYVWWRRWRAGGTQALVSRGRGAAAAGCPHLSWTGYAPRWRRGRPRTAGQISDGPSQESPR
jgi:Homeodomain-like domain